MANSYIYSLTDNRWIDGTVQYTGIGLAVTSTNASSNSNMLRLTFNDSVNYRVRYDGAVFANGSISCNGAMIATGNISGNNITGKLFAANTVPPVTASANGVQGEIRFDTSYVYVCVSSNVWMRAALNTW